MGEFSQLIGPMFLLSYKLFCENENLRATRDVLLPRLISGEIDVDNLAIELAEAA